MQPLGTYDLYVNIFAAVVLPLILAANLNPRVRSSGKNAYLWREHAKFMWLSMVIIGLLSMWSMVQLAGHFGLVSGQMVQSAMPVFGIPFLILAVAEIWMAGRIAIGFLQARRAAG
jgi:hypothetical protein